jgi:hypothetical protein
MGWQIGVLFRVSARIYRRWHKHEHREQGGEVRITRQVVADAEVRCWWLWCCAGALV